MEGLLQNLIAEKGLDKVLEFLNLNKEENNPLIFGMPDSLPFGPRKFNLLPTIARTGINAALKGGFSSAAFPLALGAGILGLGYYRNPLREGAPNYNPRLQGQIDYLSENNLIGTNIGPGQGFTRYGPGSVLQGKNVMSGFGTNDYLTMLNKYIDKMEANKKISAEGKERKLRKAREEKQKFLAESPEIQVDYQGAGDGSGGGGGGSWKEQTAAKEKAGKSVAGPGFGKGAYFARGGIASLL